jgi:hypothetical protein
MIDLSGFRRLELTEAEVWIFDDRMEVMNPGGLVEGITLEKFRERRSIHMRPGTRSWRGSWWTTG